VNLTTRLSKGFPCLLGVAISFLGVCLPCWAQVDPTPRQLVQVGYNQPVQGKAPFAGYAFYYHNEPGFVRPDWTLRAAVAPVYVDLELAFRGLIAPQTDFAVGLAGGGFADNYAEIRRGVWRQEESFSGHAGEINSSVYHLFNPLPDGATPTSLMEMPLQGVFRVGFRESIFDRNARTAAGFELPDDLPSGFVRAGLRWGGREPIMRPDVAVELSVWYQGQARFSSGDYGFVDDRSVQPSAHQFWGRALVANNFTNTGHYLEMSLTAGAVLNADRLSAFRLGGTLPLGAEFPLMLPGYYFEELSAQRFLLADALLIQPLIGRWDLLGYGGTALVDYTPGLEQPGQWHSGVGGGLGWTSSNAAWQVMLGYAYGVDAIRDEGRGAHNVGFLVQWDLRRRGTDSPSDSVRIQSMVRRLNASSWRGFNRLFQK